MSTGEEVPFGQPVTVQGTAVNLRGDSLPGVVVRVFRNSRVITDSVTNDNGTFQCEIPSGERFDLICVHSGTQLDVIEGLAGNVPHTIRVILLLEVEGPPLSADAAVDILGEYEKLMMKDTE